MSKHREKQLAETRAELERLKAAGLSGWKLEKLEAEQDYLEGLLKTSKQLGYIIYGCFSLSVLCGIALIINKLLGG